MYETASDSGKWRRLTENNQGTGEIRINVAIGFLQRVLRGGAYANAIAAHETPDFPWVFRSRFVL